jgi:hypothetical protein
MSFEYKQVAIFGNAMTVLIPLEWIDVSDYRPVPDNQEMFSDFGGEEEVAVEAEVVVVEKKKKKLRPSMICVEIVESIGDEVTKIDSSKVRAEDNLAKFYLEDLKDLMDVQRTSETTTTTTRDWRFVTTEIEEEKGNKKKAAVVSKLCSMFENSCEVVKDRVDHETMGSLMTLPIDEEEEEEEEINKESSASERTQTTFDYTKDKCEWISFAEEENCLVPSKDENGNDVNESVTISMFVHRLEKKYETDILVSFVRPYSNKTTAQTKNNPGNVASQTLQMIDWSLLGLDD